MEPGTVRGAGPELSEAPPSGEGGAIRCRLYNGVPPALFGLRGLPALAAVRLRPR